MTPSGDHATDRATPPSDSTGAEAPVGAEAAPAAAVGTESPAGVDAEATAPAVAAHAVRRPPRRPQLDERALSRKYPAWGLSSLLLLVVGLIASYASLVGLGPGAMQRCLAQTEAGGCDPRIQGIVLALPVGATVLGLVACLMGGRLVARRGRSPVLATAVGWALFVLTIGIGYVVTGGPA